MREPVSGSLFQLENMEKEKISLRIYPDGYEQDVYEYTLNDFTDMMFPVWEQAMEHIIDEMDKHQYLAEFMHEQMHTDCEVVVGNHTFVGIDIMDFMN